MKIAQITISNCRNVLDLDVSVGDHLVLVGPNACGKSTVLRLLDALLAWRWGRLQNELDVELLRDPSGPLLIRVSLDGLNDIEIAGFADEIEFVGPSELPQLTIELIASISLQDPEVLEISRSFTKEGVKPVAVKSGHLDLLSWHLLRADRNAELELAANRNGAVGQLLRATELGSDEANLINAFEEVDRALGSAESLGYLRSEIAASLSSVYPSDVCAADLIIGLPSVQDPLRSVEILLRTTDYPDGVGLLEQSDGIRSLSAMSLQILSRGDSAVTAIDEPEVHLHPRSQARVARLFAKPSGQRVIATHSATVVRAFHPAQVLALTSRGPRQLSTDSVTANPKFFSQWWVENMIEPLVSRSLIIVEGTSDEIIARRVAELRGIDFDRQDISVVTLNGAGGFPNVYKLFGPEGFNISLSSLVDASEAHYPAEVLGVHEDQLNNHFVAVCAEDLEDEYVRALGPERVVNLLRSSGFGFPDVNEDNVLDRCRGRNKVNAALALKLGISPAEAQKIVPVNLLIDFALTQR